MECIKTLEEHRSNIQCMKALGIHLYTSSSDSTIKIWNQDGVCVNTIDYLTYCDWIYDLEIWNTGGEEFLCSCHHSKIIKVWDPSGTCVEVLKGHTEPIYCLTVWEKYLCSGCDDGVVKVWEKNKDDFRCVYTLKGRGGSVWKMIVWKGYLCFGSEMWDKNGECINAHEEGHKDIVTDIVVWGNVLCSSSEDTTIKIWKEGKCVDTINTIMPVLCMIVWDEYLYSGHQDGTIMVRERDKVYKQKGHKSNVWLLIILNNYLYSVSFDKTIRVWNKKRECVDILKCHKNSACWTVFGGCLCIGGYDGTIKIWKNILPTRGNFKKLWKETQQDIVRTRIISKELHILRDVEAEIITHL